jgi:hypothetical protein
MVQITVSDELAHKIASGPLPIVLVDSRGNTLGQVRPVAALASVDASISEEELAEIKRRMAEDDGARFTTAQLLDHLRALAPE